MPSESEFQGRVYIVTGAAGGVGSELTRLLLRQGARVVAQDLNPEVEQQFPQQEVATQVADVAGDTVAESAVALALGRFGRLDGLINNAARFIRRAPDETTLDDWDALMRTNVRGAFLHTRVAAPEIARQHGSIVNIASTSGLIGARGQIAYTATKGAIVQLTRTSAIEYAPDVRVNAVAPGPIDTHFMDETLGGHEHTRARLEAVVDNIPLRRVSTALEVAEVTMFLLSHAARGITGAIIPIDGGLTAQ